MMTKKLHDWPKRWEVVQRRLDSGEVDWPNFRRDRQLLRSLQGVGHNEFLKQWTLCGEERVPMSWRVDSEAGNPEGWVRKGIFATPTSLRMARTLHRIKSHWAPLRSGIKVLEIGGGFGGLARTILTHMNGVRKYVLIDGEPCLEMQRRYLMMTHPEAPIEFVLPEDALRLLISERFDLVINMSAFSEMTLQDVEGYFALIHIVLVSGGLFYSLNRDRYSNDGDETGVSFAEFPFDDRWISRSPTTPFHTPLWVEVIKVRR